MVVETQMHHDLGGGATCMHALNSPGVCLSVRVGSTSVPQYPFEYEWIELCRAQKCAMI